MQGRSFLKNQNKGQRDMTYVSFSFINHIGRDYSDIV